YAALENNFNFMEDFLGKTPPEHVRQILEKIPHDVLIHSPDFMYLMTHLALFDSKYLHQLYLRPGALREKLVSTFPNEVNLEYSILRLYFTNTKYSPVLLSCHDDKINYSNLSERLRSIKNNSVLKPG